MVARIQPVLLTFIGLFICLSSGFAPAGEKSANDPGAKKQWLQIQALVQQLGDKKFARREQADRALRKIGDRAWEALQHASRHHRDLEVRKRLQSILEAIERQWQLQTFRGHRDAVTSVTVSPDGRLLGSAGRSEGVVRLWEIKTGKELRRFQPRHLRQQRWDAPAGWTVQWRGGGGWTWDAQFSPNGSKLLSANGSLHLWDVKSGKELFSFPTARSVVRAVIAPNGNWALSGSDKEKAPRLWNLKTGKEVRRFQGHTQPAWNVAVSPDGRQVCSCSKDGTIRIWDLRTAKKLHCLKGHSQPVTAAIFSPNGKHILSSSWDKTLKLWELTTGKVLQTFQGHQDKVCDVAFSPNGKRALSGSFDRRVILWDIQTGRMLRRFKGHTGIVGTVAFHPNGSMALSGSYDKTIRFWRLPK